MKSFRFCSTRATERGRTCASGFPSYDASGSIPWFPICARCDAGTPSTVWRPPLQQLSDRMAHGAARDLRRAKRRRDDLPRDRALGRRDRSAIPRPMGQSPASTDNEASSASGAVLSKGAARWVAPGQSDRRLQRRGRGANPAGTRAGTLSRVLLMRRGQQQEQTLRRL